MAIQNKRQGHYFDFVVSVASLKEDDSDLLRDFTSLRLRTSQEQLSDSSCSDYSCDERSIDSSLYSSAAGKNDSAMDQPSPSNPPTEPLVHHETDLSFLCLGDDTLQDLSQLDEYHLGLLQTAGSNPKSYKPSFRRNGVILQQNEPLKCPAPDVQKIRPAPRSKPKPRNLVLSQHRHIPHKDYQRESFWLYEEETVTPRVTLTRYDLRSDEKEIYGWKHGTTSKR
ncbi:hypothetical protein AAL_00788 [Moelleriella libera RCEF 2490]|uniref:Uncharacterized protein n=1 Tax=Moelleriella libera RCEF 2490 TaxID=1081109 RepID=A0A166V6K8_9HYPO|nr:hypothetical protein AAL_00788 [Moelleriella libera RCEF 2490]